MELNEGSVWEAIMYAPHNKLQGYGKTNEVINLEPLNQKLQLGCT